VAEAGAARGSPFPADKAALTAATATAAASAALVVETAVLVALDCREASVEAVVGGLAAACLRARTSIASGLRTRTIPPSTTA